MENSKVTPYPLMLIQRFDWPEYFDNFTCMFCKETNPTNYIIQIIYGEHNLLVCSEDCSSLAQLNVL